MCRVGRFIVAYMDEMIRKLYAQMQMEKKYDDPIEQRVREELLRLLEFQAEHRKAESRQRSEVETEALNEKLQKKWMPREKKQSDQSEPASANGAIGSEVKEAARMNEAISETERIAQTKEEISRKTEKTARMNGVVSDDTKKTAASYNDSSEIDRLYAAAEVGEEAGFVRGFRYGFRLCMECMQNENIL